MTLYTDERTKTQYKYYRIYRSDGYMTHCSVVNWLNQYFIRMYGKPTEWEESEEKAQIQGELTPVKIEASANGYTFIIELVKEMYHSIELRYIDY